VFAEDEQPGLRGSEQESLALPSTAVNHDMDEAIASQREHRRWDIEPRHS
jgi:hypothetical protein